MGSEYMIDALQKGLSLVAGSYHSHPAQLSNSHSRREILVIDFNDRADGGQPVANHSRVLVADPLAGSSHDA